MTSNTNKIVLILTGCFNPPTPMHFRMFELARDHIHHLNLGQVIGGIVSPVHDNYKKEGLISSKHRLAMVRLGLESSDWIKVSDWEANEDDWTRTKQVLQHHSSHLNSLIVNNGGSKSGDLNGNQPQEFDGAKNEKIQVKLLCGADLLESFAKPGLWNENDLEVILQEHGLVVVSRSGCNPEKFIFDSDQLTRHRKNIIILTNWEMSDMSSTIIRRYLKRGLSAKYILDDKILSYIHKNELYRPLTTSEYKNKKNRSQKSLISMDIDEVDSISSPNKKIKKRKKTKN